MKVLGGKGFKQELKCLPSGNRMDSAKAIVGCCGPEMVQTAISDTTGCPIIQFRPDANYLKSVQTHS